MSYAYLCIGPDDEARMRDEHAFLSRQLDEIIRLTRAGDQAGCEFLWEGFVRELESHMRYEEQLLFPRFERSGRAPHFPIEQLRLEHDDLRSQCQALSCEFIDPTLHTDRLQGLADALRDHKDREGSVLYPWLASLRRPHFSWEVMRELPQ